MNHPIVDIGMAYCGDWTGLMMTLSGLRKQIFVDGLDDLVSLSVVDNLCDHTAADVRREVERCGGRYIAFPEPKGTAPPRDRLFREAGAPWQGVLDDHMEFMPGDLAWLVKFVTGNLSDDLYHGVMLASHVGHHGQPTIRWTHWAMQWSDQGHFGVHHVNPAAVDPDLPPFQIPHSGLGFFLARRASWLGLPEEQRGFGAEGYLPLAYRQAGRAVWCLPHVRHTHVFLPASIKPKRPNRWDDRARNYLGYWKRLQKNPYLTFAGIKTAHCRPDRLPAAKWAAIVQELQIDEAESLAADPPLVAMPSRPAATPSRDPTAWQTCQHRGDVIATRKADLCGLGGKMFAVHACTIHGECVLTRFCKKQPEQACYLCPDAIAEAPPVTAAPMTDVAVVIPCHNYGRYLAEAIESCLQQTTRPAEIIVIDDASTDNTADVAAQYADRGVRYERIEARSVYHARRRGMELTTAPFLVFLDADDTLGATYLERGRAEFADSQVGLAWTDLTHVGNQTKVKHWHAGNIEQDNWIHAGAMVRRVALEQSRAMEARGAVRNGTEDWFAWREVLRGGWQHRKFDAVYEYRQHGSGCHLERQKRSYFENAHLDHETVPIILPLAGRDQWWHQLTDWVQRQTWESIELIVIDSSANAEFQRRTRQWLASQDCATTYIPLSGTPGLADEDRRNRTHYRAVQRIMPTIYRHLERSQREYNLIVEDDVLPPDDAIERLMQAMTPRVACVSGVVRSRYQDAIIAWDDNRCRSIPELRTGVQKIYGTGFGCLLYRRSVFSQCVLHHGGSGNFDHEVSHDVARLERDWLVDWDVHCVHAGLPAVPKVLT